MGVAPVTDDSLFDPAPFSQGPPDFERACLDARSVPCPHCAAGVGAPCKRPSGHVPWGNGTHVGRLVAAREALDRQDRDAER